MGRLAGRRMSGRPSRLALAVLYCLYLAQSALAACPSPDLTGDCFVDFEDFAAMAAQWPTTDFSDIAEIAAHWLTPDPRVPPDMAYMPDGTFEMGDSFGEGYSDELPVHTVTVDSFYMGKYEITNRQYCDYLNSAMSQGLITVMSSGAVYKPGWGADYPYCDTHTGDAESQIGHSGGVFSVRTKSGRDMAYDPMVQVSWYGAAAYCNWRSQQDGYEQCYNLSTWNCDFNKKGYRLATEAEWEYAARGGLAEKRFPWGDTISQTQANFRSSASYSYDVSPVKDIFHPLWNDGIWPYTSPVGFFDGTMKYKADYQWAGADTSYQTSNGANSYGLYDMAGNVYEWCNDRSAQYSWLPQTNPTGLTSGSYRVFRGGGWYRFAFHSRVTIRAGRGVPYARSNAIGFRLVLDLN